jgi:hypothetical protein
LTGLEEDMEVGSAEGILHEKDEGRDSVLILSSTGASGISSSLPNATSADSTYKPTATSAQPLKPDSNTNIAQPRTLIPVLARDVVEDLTVGDHILAVTSIFAVSAHANGGRKAATAKTLAERWADKPRIAFGPAPGQNMDCLVLEG